MMRGAQMHRFVLIGLLSVAGAAVASLVAPVLAQQPQAAPAGPQKPPAQNPVGVGAGWSAQVDPKAPNAGVTLESAQVETVKKINGYFNELVDMKGQFLQTGADNKQLKGKFYVKRPGRFRFDYAAPSKLVIVSDGNILHIEDNDLKTKDEYHLNDTPFRILMKKDVDLLKDAQIKDLQEVSDLITVTLVDKTNDSSGKIKLFLTKSPNLELKEWVTTDAQGLDTRIEISNLVKGEAADPNLFKGAKMQFPGSAN